MNNFSGKNNWRTKLYYHHDFYMFVPAVFIPGLNIVNPIV